MRTTAPALLSLLMLGASSQASTAELFMTLAESPPQTNMITTERPTNLTLRASSGQAVHFARTAGHDYRQQVRGGALWAEVTSVPLNAESISLTPTLVEDGSLNVKVEISRNQNDETLRYNSTVSTTPGVWVKLFGPAETGSGAGRVYSTNQQTDDALYLRIDIQ